eukprot:GFKZ01001974.1.p1 GENE.GFKZ01001974.1~~GFKZ01001974.1.p1  ORF type:complete len:1046 (-),score=154.52 GFKZ01001974.1:2181-5294(-)
MSSSPKPLEKNSRLLAQICLADPIEVWWPYDQEYYPGVIAALLPNRRYRVHYDDGEVEELDLSAEQWRFRGHAARRVSSNLTTSPTAAAAAAAPGLPADDPPLAHSYPTRHKQEPRLLHMPQKPASTRTRAAVKTDTVTAAVNALPLVRRRNSDGAPAAPAPQLGSARRILPRIPKPANSQLVNSGLPVTKAFPAARSVKSSPTKRGAKISPATRVAKTSPTSRIVKTSPVARVTKTSPKLPAPAPPAPPSPENPPLERPAARRKRPHPAPSAVVASPVKRVKQAPKPAVASGVAEGESRGTMVVGNKPSDATAVATQAPKSRGAAKAAPPAPTGTEVVGAVDTAEGEDGKGKEPCQAAVGSASPALDVPRKGVAGGPEGAARSMDVPKKGVAGGPEGAARSESEMAGPAPPKGSLGRAEERAVCHLRELAAMKGGRVSLTNVDGAPENGPEAPDTLDLSDAQALQLAAALRKAKADAIAAKDSPSSALPSTARAARARSSSPPSGVARNDAHPVLRSARQIDTPLPSLAGPLLRAVRNVNSRENSVEEDQRLEKGAASASVKGSMVHGTRPLIQRAAQVLATLNSAPRSEQGMPATVKKPPATSSAGSSAVSPEGLAAKITGSVGAKGGASGVQQPGSSQRLTQGAEKVSDGIDVDGLIESVTISTNQAVQKALDTLVSSINANQSKTDEKLGVLGADLSSLSKLSETMSKRQDEFAKSLGESGTSGSLTVAVGDLTTKVRESLRSEIFQTSNKTKQVLRAEFGNRLDATLKPLAGEVQRTSQLMSEVPDSIGKVVTAAVTKAFERIFPPSPALSLGPTHHGNGEAAIGRESSGNATDGPSSEKFLSSWQGRGKYGSLPLEFRISDAKMAQLKKVASQARELTGLVVISWMMFGSCRSRAPSNERAMGVSEGWVAAGTKACINHTAFVLQSHSSFKEALTDCKRNTNADGVEIGWLLYGPSEENLNEARKSYAKWDPKLMDYEWESEKRVLRCMATELLKSEEQLLKMRHRIFDPLLWSLRCVQITKLRAYGMAGM